ncbi:floral homeotic protein [Perilla frutescens var. hirtella]|uniref:Floral homeotic protein n=1 Tax=Perilla frutescens var. hirtella TaxID=608512 RepID=A0AAD4JGS9_PERFH|nr:floral homeotic protein [Perilla frutescens var. frutescens]KAH6787829.1 floral homeotic protein [Perilla frutescens var. hirtella]KAH6833579.1 floral homeotic protein [Perilla frutescens var. hirtella]
MSNQLYGYTSTTYGGAGGGAGGLFNSRSTADSYIPADSSLLGTSSRYLSADLLSSSSAISSSLLYNPESYSARIPGLSGTTPTRSYGPPGVDVAATVPTDPLYAGLKRTSSESLYHQTLLGAHNKIGQTDAWYSTNPLVKRTRYESTSHLPIYPQRPGEKDCAFYMQTRTCKFGESCKFDHPVWVPEGGIPDWKEVPLVPSESLPERPGEPDCPYFLKTQRCKFGVRCKFNHPKDSMPPGAPEDGDTLPDRPSEPPCAFYMKTGKCKFGSTCKYHHPKGVQIQSTGEENINGLQNIMLGDTKALHTTFAPALLHNTKGLPIRPGEEDCPFYLKTGSCKYGATCRYNHPDRYAINPPSALTSTLLASPSAHFNLGVVAPTVSLLPSFDPRLAQATVGLTPTIYPQRPGQLECDYYMKTGICKFGNNCKFHHPMDRSAPTVSAAESPQQNVKLTLAGLPRREGAIHCPYYMKTGTCKYGPTCKFDHPPPGEVMSSAVDEAKENGDV